MFEMFKPEDITRKNFDEANKDNQQTFQKRLSDATHLRPDAWGRYAERKDIHDMIKWAMDNDREIIKKMYEMSEKEATVLNEEYDRLANRVKEAMEALETFEKEKLGMHQENKEEK